MTARVVVTLLMVLLAAALGPHLLVSVLTAGIGQAPAVAVAAPPAGVAVMLGTLAARCARLHREGVLWWA